MLSCLLLQDLFDRKSSYNYCNRDYNTQSVSGISNTYSAFPYKASKLSIAAGFGLALLD